MAASADMRRRRAQQALDASGVGSMDEPEVRDEEVRKPKKRWKKYIKPPADERENDDLRVIPPEVVS